MSVSQNHSNLTSIIPLATSSSSSSSSNPTSSNSSLLTRAPPIVMSQIFSYLSADNLATMACVSSKAKSISELPHLWVPHCRARKIELEKREDPKSILAREAILSSTDRFKLFDPKKELEKGMNISEATATKMQRLTPKIVMGEKDDELEWLSTGNNLVFKLTGEPQRVFKIVKPEKLFQNSATQPKKKELLSITPRNHKIHSRFENMVKATEVCVTHRLDLLIIPHAKTFSVKADDGNTYDFIVEQTLDLGLDSNKNSDEELYHTHSTKLNETARQLATFVAKTAFNDVIWRNIPILREAQEFQGPRRIALVDLEHMTSTLNGFIGDSNGSCGLIACMSSEKQIDIVIAEALKQGVKMTPQQAQNAKDLRLQALESDQKLRDLYERNGITTGKEPIRVEDFGSLGLNLAEEGIIAVPPKNEKGEFMMDAEVWEDETITLRKATEDVIAEINKLIQNSSDQGSIKDRRYFRLDVNADHLRTYMRFGLRPGNSFPSEQEKKQSWLHRIVSALVDKGHIQKIDKIHGSGYFIQA